MKKKTLFIVGGISVIIAVLIYIIIDSKKTFEEQGLYTIAKVTNWESAEQGSHLYFDVYYDGKIYKSSMDEYGYTVGNYYFVKILPSDPTRNEGLLDTVPSCILKEPIPKHGWKKIPICSND